MDGSSSKMEYAKGAKVKTLQDEPLEESNGIVLWCLWLHISFYPFGNKSKSKMAQATCWKYFNHQSQVDWFWINWNLKRILI